MIAKEKNIDKIDVEELIKPLKVTNLENFTLYLKEIFRDLGRRSDDKFKGINKITFCKYYELPGIISERLFSVFDRNNNDYLDINEFIEGMTTLMTESFDKHMKFIFHFYDFDKDGLISKEDVQVVLSYIPFNDNKQYFGSVKLRFEKQEYRDRVESQDEIYKLLEKCFEDKEKINFQQFLEITENVNSDIFLFVLILLLEKKPFSLKTLDQYDNGKKLKIKNSLTPITYPNKLIASPSLNSKFSPCYTIAKTPLITKKILSLDQKSVLNKYSGISNTNKINELGKKDLNKVEEEAKDFEDNTLVKSLPINKKNFNNLKNIEDVKQNKNFVTIEEKLDKIDLNSEKKEINYDSDLEEFDIKFEGYLYKMTQSQKLKKLWFKLIGKDLYYFRRQEDNLHKGMHNLSGVFLKEEKTSRFDEIEYFCFAVVYPKKIRLYYHDNEGEFNKWVKVLHKATRHETITDKYEVKDKLGNGKFGLVRLGIHKESGRKVAIKIMSKKNMTMQDLELVKTEIDVLKICQQPNIIKLYDIFENSEYIYIIMEYCSGGDLFTYIEKRGFKLSEPRASQIIHKLSTAIFFLHSYGIAHRDIKPENILMTDSSDDADIRLVDFGLSKIIGPNETCVEPFGTLSYVAPEILLEKPYSKAVDIWSIGVITYLLLCGFLPFDDEHSEREIARQTINDPVPFPNSLWRKISVESKMFVENLLFKDPNKRMNIKEVLEHSWIQKFNKNKITDHRGTKDFEGSNFKIYTVINEEEAVNIFNK